jgi:hypothetical protein
MAKTAVSSDEVNCIRNDTGSLNVAFKAARASPLSAHTDQPTYPGCCGVIGRDVRKSRCDSDFTMKEIAKEEAL